MSVVFQLQAPRKNGEILEHPPLASTPEVVNQNRRVLADQTISILGRNLQDLRREAAREALRAATGYIQHAGEPLPETAAASLIMAGHQPELFHPGVWIKNFALRRIADRCHAVPINLLVDNDVVKSLALPVPSVQAPLPPIEGAALTLGNAAFDRGQGEVPFEECTVTDEEFFGQFPMRVETDWGFQPMLQRFWEEVGRQTGRTQLVGERFAAARRALERSWGCHNLELPVSLVCETESFAWFLVHLLKNLPRFHLLYNSTVQSYRQRYRIRSNNHPVPDLTADGDWLEAPFWAWRAGAKKRQRLYARTVGERIELRSGQTQWLDLSGSTESALDAWRDLIARGFKFRNRALTNTLFARVFLCDLFVHGIGGGKYDELTDALIREFYGLQPPDYLMVSGTLRLPLPHYSATEEDARRLWRRRRELQFNPQRHLAEAEGIDDDAFQLVEEKQRWIERRWTSREQRNERFEALRQITNQLRGYFATAESAAQQELERCHRQLQANQVLQRRDYAFCLYPEDLLREFCQSVTG